MKLSLGLALKNHGYIYQPISEEISQWLVNNVNVYLGVFGLFCGFLLAYVAAFLHISLYRMRMRKLGIIL